MSFSRRLVEVEKNEFFSKKVLLSDLFLISISPPGGTKRKFETHRKTPNKKL